MPLTPEDVSAKRFTPVRLREGYDMSEVDQFLDEVEAELARLTKENDDLRAKLAAAQSAGGGAVAPAAQPKPAEPEKKPEPVTPAAAPAAAATATTFETLRVETTADATSVAARMLELAEREARGEIEKAKGEADAIVGEARTKAERLETESKAKADKVESEARARAQMLDSETAERRQQLFGDLEKEKDRLSAEVETLRAFEREYRARLKSYFTQQLETLAATESEAPAEHGVGAPKRLRSVLGEDEG